MKVRIKPNSNSGIFRFSVQKKTWYGWKTLYQSDLIKYCHAYIDDLMKIANVEVEKL